MPPQYAAYPRGLLYGSADQLQALMQGYYALSLVFVVNLVLVVPMNVIYSNSGAKNLGLGILLAWFMVVFLVIGGLTYGPNKKIIYGKGWAPVYAVLASVLMGLNSALCCGIIGYAVMQSIAAGEIKRYGIKGGIFGMNKKVILAEIDQRRAMEAGQATAGAQAGPS